MSVESDVVLRVSDDGIGIRRTRHTAAEASETCDTRAERHGGSFTIRPDDARHGRRMARPVPDAARASARGARANGMRRPVTISVDIAMMWFAAFGAQCGERQPADVVEVVAIRDLTRDAGHAHAPAAVRERVDVVDLERDNGIAGGRIELRAGRRADEDTIAVEHEVHRQDHRQRAAS